MMDIRRPALLSASSLKKNMEDRKTENNNEQEMLRGIQRGDAAAAQALYRSHVRYLSAIASRYIACEEDLRDVLQDCFLKIFSSIASFTYQGPGSLKGWMAKITLNETLKFIRKSGRLEFTELNRQGAEPTDEDPDTEDIPTDAIYRMIRELPDGYRTIFNLHVVEGKKHKEIARLLHIAESTSASQFHRAKAMLADKLKQYRQHQSQSV